jgi:hypothetical protein
MIPACGVAHTLLSLHWREAGFAKHCMSRDATFVASTLTYMRPAVLHYFDDRARPPGPEVEDDDSQRITISREQSTDFLPDIL